MTRPYTQPEVNYAKVRKSRTVPDQSMTIQEIVKRYVRGIPVDVVKREPVYVDQNDHDLEKLSRMDFHEKAEYAQGLSEYAEGLRNGLQEHERSKAEAKAKAAQEAAQKAIDEKASKEAKAASKEAKA